MLCFGVVLGFVCPPCGIKFSSLSTLEAHQTYYCSHRQKKPSKGESKIEISLLFSENMNFVGMFIDVCPIFTYPLPVHRLVNTCVQYRSQTVV